MHDIRLAIDAARLLGRWTLIAEKHSTGCSCCPGLGDVTMTRSRAALRPGFASVIPSFKTAKHHRPAQGLYCALRSRPAPEVLQPLFRDLAEALEHLEQVQRGF